MEARGVGPVGSQATERILATIRCWREGGSYWLMGPWDFPWISAPGCSVVHQASFCEGALSPFRSSYSPEEGGGGGWAIEKGVSIQM